MGGWRCGYLRRSREGSDYTTINLYFVSHVFQSTLPRRERRGLADCCEPMDRFQSTLPRRERHQLARMHPCAPSYFNPRSREGSDRRSASAPGHRRIFQSTLPRRERRFPRILCRFRTEFQSTLPRRERPLPELHPTDRHHFNPRSREGSDASWALGFGLGFGISIHAPAKGATARYGS